MSSSIAKKLMTDECSDGYSCARVMANAAKELRTLTNSAHHIQGVVGKLIANSPSGADETIRDLQALDHITQSIEGLAQFLDALSGDTPSNWEYPDLAAADRVKLEDMARRLLNKPPNCSPPSDDDGELDLF